MDIFEFDNFRNFLKESLKSMPNQGHGFGKKIAQAADMSTAFFSQVLSGKRLLSLEQASLISDFLQLTPLQSDYFLVLVQLDRAGNESLRKKTRSQMLQIRKTAQAVANRFTQTSEISEQDKPIYYSDWVYGVVQQLTAIDEYKTEFKIAERLSLPLKKVREVLDFLLQAGLCVNRNNRYEIGPTRIHLPPNSPWIRQHHANCRTLALECLHFEDPHKLHYSSPMTLSKKDYEKIRKILIEIIEKVGKIVDPSPSEELICLNIDLFKILKRTD